MKKRCHRKYRPADPAANAAAIARQLEFDAAHAQRIENLVRTAYQRMREGNGTDDDFDRVGAALNVAMIRAEKVGNGKMLVDGLKAGVAAMVRADEIRERHGRYGFSGPDLLAMNCALDFYVQLLTHSTPAQMHQAMLEAADRLREQVRQERRGAIRL
jgi:hypothetical protein